MVIPYFGPVRISVVKFGSVLSYSKSPVLEVTVRFFIATLEAFVTAIAVV